MEEFRKLLDYWPSLLVLIIIIGFLGEIKVLFKLKNGYISINIPRMPFSQSTGTDEEKKNA